MKPTQIGLAKHIGYTAPGISKMKKQNPDKFKILWLGWLEYCKSKESKNANQKDELNRNSTITRYFNKRIESDK